MTQTQSTLEEIRRIRIEKATELQKLGQGLIVLDQKKSGGWHQVGVGSSRSAR